MTTVSRWPRSSSTNSASAAQSVAGGEQTSFDHQTDSIILIKKGVWLMLYLTQRAWPRHSDDAGTSGGEKGRPSLRGGGGAGALLQGAVYSKYFYLKSQNIFLSVLLCEEVQGVPAEHPGDCPDHAGLGHGHQLRVSLNTGTHTSLCIFNQKNMNI